MEAQLRRAVVGGAGDDAGARGGVDEAALAQLRSGITLNDGRTKPARAEAIAALRNWAKGRTVGAD